MKEASVQDPERADGFLFHVRLEGREKGTLNSLGKGRPFPTKIKGNKVSLEPAGRSRAVLRSQSLDNIALGGFRD